MHGVSVPEIRKIAKEYRKDHELALELWKTGISEARIVAAMIDDPEKLTERQMEEWVKDINSWDICDQVCMNLFEKPPPPLGRRSSTGPSGKRSSSKEQPSR